MKNKLTEISLSDKRYFELFIGKRVLKKQLWGMEKGSIPLFSANPFKPFGFVKKSNIKNFDSDFVIWGIDGNFEFNVIKKGTKFATTDHCGSIRIKDKNIMPEYLCSASQSVKSVYGFDRTLRASLKNMAKIRIKIPLIEKNGNDFVFDKEYQKIVSGKFNKLTDIKNNLSSLKTKLENQMVTIPKEEKMQNLSIEKIFDLSIQTNRSKFTKNFINKNKGSIPVYSASKEEDFVNYGYVKDNLEGVKYFENCLTWNIDGSVGKAFFRKGRFTLSEKVIPLIFRDEFKETIDSEYVKYLLEEKALEFGFQFSNKAGKSKIKDIEIPFPVTKEGKLNLERQMEISQKYKELEIIKSKLIGRLDGVIDSSSNINLA